MRLTRQHLRHHALASSLFPRTTLGRAITRLGFVQADPIRAPARAQDLILRQRVTGYRVGDLDRVFRSLRLEEDFLYAYGFMPPSTRHLLHPRLPRIPRELTATERDVLALVSTRRRPLHPRELEAHLGTHREINAWGGYSKATTRALEHLHYLGLLRVAGREAGVKLYEQAAPTSTSPALPDPDTRLRQLVLRIATILQPISEPSLRSTLQHLRHAAPHLPGRKAAVDALLQSGALLSAEVDGQRYLWPAGRLLRAAPAPTVRFLAPFDPVVWDRRRFEHLWGWPYRFEAYTPQPKRKLGYYALPLLWQADIIGWVNITGPTQTPQVAPGYVKAHPPQDPAFQTAFDEEWEGLKLFLSGRAGKN